MSTEKVTKKKEPLNLMFPELSQVRRLVFPVNLSVLMRISKPSRCSTSPSACIISEKVNGIIKANINSLKSTCKKGHYYNKIIKHHIHMRYLRYHKKIIIAWENKDIFLRS